MFAGRWLIGAADAFGASRAVNPGVTTSVTIVARVSPPITAIARGLAVRGVTAGVRGVHAPRLRSAVGQAPSISL
jgi:hypothetical protein